MPDYKLIVFDWDGTLMDSLSRIADCMQAAARDLGLEPATEQQVHGVVGLALDLAIQQLHPALAPEQLLGMQERYAQHYVTAETTPSPFYQGVPELLTELRQRGKLLSVATGKSRKGLERVFAAHAVGHWFHSSRCADETRSKPEPDMLLEILDYHGMKPRQALMVGDTTFDLEMARRAGVDAVGVTWGAHDITRLQRHRPQTCVDSVQQLATWLQQVV
ncbi:MAG: HAD-IA family hydrolase [Pseudomonadota bacterium]|nr:HAD-IA family hydrolase [Pseudomonadota bacterium]